MITECKVFTELSNFFESLLLYKEKLNVSEKKQIEKIDDYVNELLLYEKSMTEMLITK